jgi:predicted ATPase/class 3 adenylate cyclase
MAPPEAANSGRIPSGTITLLFTDIQGSTKLWEAERGPMAAALRLHDEILRSAIESAGGYVFKTVGDAFCAAFETAQAAITAALAAQRSLTRQDWPTSRPILVRMGLHTGACEERDGDYFGPVVNRAARLEAVAHGGQALVSGTTADLLAGSLPDGAGLTDLGLHRLKDLGRPEQVYQLTAEFLAASFPPLASLDNPDLPNNLPTLVSAFVGRERELAEVRQLISNSRLVTLTGAGGSGKTRLALQAAAEQIGRVPDGVWLTELAPLTDGGQIPGAVAVVLGLQDPGGSLATEMVVRALASQDTLLVLDNCEHLIDAAAKFCEHIMLHAPRVRFLITSREPLGIDGEQVYRVPSLSLPPLDAGTTEELTAGDAMRLFAERARAHQPGFAVDEQAAPLAATICRRLDGIPLALELAAARLSSMSLAQIAARLDQRFRLLTGGSRNAMPRQQTLQATVDWSFSLLTQPERDVLTRLSVFAGGFDLEAAEAVCPTDTIDVFDVLDLVGSLVDKSLVIADHTPGTVRYRLLETIRQYSSQELLRAAGDDGVLQARDRHAAYYLSLVEAAEPHLKGHGQGEWLRRLDTEWDNVRGAMAHLAAEDRADDILRLGVCLQRFSLTRGHPEVLSYLRAAVDGHASGTSVLLSEAMTAAAVLIGFFHRADGGLVLAGDYAERALAMAREAGDKRAEAHALFKLIESAYIAGDTATARACAEQGVAIARELGDVQMLGEHLSGLAAVSSEAEKGKVLAEALVCARQSGDDLMAVNELNNVFSMCLHAGRLEDGMPFLEEAVALAKKIGGEMLQNILGSNLALMRLVQGRQAEAAPLVRKALLMGRRLGPSSPLGEMIFAAACCAAYLGDYLRAAKLFGAGDADIDAALALHTIKWSAAEEDLRAREQRLVREQLGEDAYEDAYRAGARLTRAEATDLALSRTGTG